MLHQSPKQMDNLGLKSSMPGSRRGAHNNLAMPVGFDPALDLRHDGVSQQFIPPAQVQPGLFAMGPKCNRQVGHAITLSFST